MYIKTNIEGYYKDTNTGAVINKNDLEYNNFKDKRKRIIEEKKLRDKIDILEQQILELQKYIKAK